MDMKMLMKMLGVDPETVQQLTTLKSKMDLLPKETQTKLMTEFIENLENAIKEQSNENK